MKWALANEQKKETIWFHKKVKSYFNVIKMGNYLKGTGKKPQEPNEVKNYLSHNDNKKKDIWACKRKNNNSMCFRDMSNTFS